MKIAIPLFALLHQKIGGTESAIYNLIIGLSAQGVQLELVHGGVERLSPEFGQWLATAPNVTLRKGTAFHGPKSLRFLEETLFGLKTWDAEWIIYPNYFMSPIRRRGQRVAVILHDVQYKVLPQYHSRARQAWLNFYLPWMFRNADLVLLISESEKSIVRRHFGDAAADKCAVIYNAIDWARLERNPPDRKVIGGAPLHKDYILSVSYWFPHKNLQTLIRAFAQLRMQRPEMHLYLAGIASPQTLRMLAEDLSDDDRAHVRILGFLSDADLGTAYRNATIFAAPSLYEGFGMPAVEAMGFGVPTLTSNLTALPEVTLGRARYVDDVLNPSAWRDAMEAILASGWHPSSSDTQSIRLRFQPQTVAQALLHRLATHFAQPSL